MKAALKRFIFRLLGKDPEAIVVTFASGDPELAQAMFAEIQRLVPDRRHFLVKPEDFRDRSTFAIYRQLRRRFRAYRIGQAAVLLRSRSAIRRVAPRRVSLRANQNPGLQRAPGASSTERSEPRSRRCCS